jgi:RNA polymerase sigma factor (sigma-70 family)
MLSPDQILQQLKRRPQNPELWAQLYDLLEPRLHKYSQDLMRRMRIDPELGDDVVQDVLLRLLENFSRITNQVSSYLHLQNYLIKSCRNKILEQQRAIQVRLSKEEILRFRFEDMVSQAFVKEIQQAENRQFVEDLLKKVNPRCQKLVRSFLLSHQALTEYAQENGIKIGTIYTQWQRCIDEFKKLVSPM